VLLLSYSISIFPFSKTCFAQYSLPGDSIDVYVQSKMLSQHIPGVALAIIKDRKLIKEGYYGLANIENNVPVTSKSVFEIASMGKQFTCAAILLLQQEGKLNVSDKLSKYLENLPDTWQDITLQQLMNHTSGMRDDWIEETPYFLINHTDSLMLEAQKKSPLLFKPGESFNYSSGPFTLGLVIKKISGKSHAQFLKEKIFEPLGMSSSSVYDSRKIVLNRVAGYTWKDNTFQNGIDISSSAEARGDVGVITSLQDMIKWETAINNKSLLTEDSWRQMFTPGKLNDGSFISYGYGWFIYPTGGYVAIEHDGAFRTGFRSDILRIPALNLTLIFLCNQWNTKISHVAYSIATMIDSKLKLVSARPFKKDFDNRITNVLQSLMKNVAHKKWNYSALYEQANFCGYSPKELQFILEGFHNLVYVDSENLKKRPLLLYNEKITKMLYYKAEGAFPSYWSFGYNDKGKLITVSREL